MRELLERATPHDERVGAERTASTDKFVLSHFVEGEDIEAFLTTIERLMSVYHIAEDRWVAKLAPQLSGRAQQAYAA